MRCWWARKQKIQVSLLLSGATKLIRDIHSSTNNVQKTKRKKKKGKQILCPRNRLGSSLHIAPFHHRIKHRNNRSGNNTEDPWCKIDSPNWHFLARFQLFGCGKRENYILIDANERLAAERWVTCIVNHSKRVGRLETRICVNFSLQNFVVFIRMNFPNFYLLPSRVWWTDWVFLTLMTRISAGFRIERDRKSFQGKVKWSCGRFLWALL